MVCPLQIRIRFAVELMTTTLMPGYVWVESFAPAVSLHFPRGFSASYDGASSVKLRHLRPSETPCCSSNALLSSSTAESMWQFRASLDQIFPSRGGREMRTWSFNASPCQPLPQRTAGWLQFYRMHSKELCLRQHKSASI